MDNIVADIIGIMAQSIFTIIFTLSSYNIDTEKLKLYTICRCPGLKCSTYDQDSVMGDLEVCMSNVC